MRVTVQFVLHEVHGGSPLKRSLFALSVLLAAPALAGERYLGAIVSGAGADTTNATTATPFYVPSDAKLTIWCNAAGYIITDTKTAATTTTAMPVSANEKFPTSTGSMVKDTSATAALGGAVVRIVGSAAVTCYVFERRGNE